MFLNTSTLNYFTAMKLLSINYFVISFTNVVMFHYYTIVNQSYLFIVVNVYYK